MNFISLIVFFIWESLRCTKRREFLEVLNNIIDEVDEISYIEFLELKKTKLGISSGSVASLKGRNGLSDPSQLTCI